MMAFKPQDPIHLKTVLYGVNGVGKSSLVDRFHRQCFEFRDRCKLGAEIILHNITIDENLVRLTIHDGVCQPQISQGYSRCAGAAMVAYDISNWMSFDKVTYYTDLIKRHCGPIPVLLVGCKSDLVKEKRAYVPYTIAREFATTHGYELIETSALLGINVEQAFTLLGAMYLQYWQYTK